MTIADLRDTVEKPATAVGLTFEPGLVADIIFDLRDDKNAQVGALPLLQYTLEQLYERRTDRTLTAAAYQAIGGVKGAIGAHAEEVFKTLDEEAQNAFARVFQALVHVDERGTPTRKRETEAVLTNTPAAIRLVEALIKRARVLRVYTEKLGDTPYVEVAHEMLLTSWESLSNWIKNVDNDLRIVQEMKTAARSWVNDGYLMDHLLSRRRLQPIYEALQRLPQDLSHDEQVFIQLGGNHLLEDFKKATELMQLHMIQDNFISIGIPAVPMLVQAYAYAKSASVQDKIIDIFWRFPEFIINPISQNLKLDDKLIRSTAIKLIDYFEITGLLSELKYPLDDPSYDVRKATVEVLGKIGDASIVPMLLEALRDIYADVWQASAHALMNVADINVLPILVNLLEDRNRHIRMAAVRVLGKLVILVLYR